MIRISPNHSRIILESLAAGAQTRARAQSKTQHNKPKTHQKQTQNKAKQSNTYQKQSETDMQRLLQVFNLSQPGPSKMNKVDESILNTKKK